MRSSDRRRFEQLKLEVVRYMRVQHPDLSADISAWRKKELELLQEALARETKSQVSEKWFYTHMKSNHGSLPRIDMLDMLSQFVGYKNWNDFKPRRPWTLAGKMLVPPLTAVLFAGGIIWWILMPRCATFCFVNLFGRQPVDPESIDVFIHPEGESPLMVTPDERGCLCIPDKGEALKITVRSAYFVNDTIIRKSRNRTIEYVALRPDDYAELIRMFATSQVSDWQSYRANLLGMFVANARIYELSAQGTAPIGLFNREEFVDLLTLPYGERTNLKVVDITYNRERISTLRFERK